MQAYVRPLPANVLPELEVSEIVPVALHVVVAEAVKAVPLPDIVKVPAPVNVIFAVEMVTLTTLMLVPIVIVGVN